MTHRRAKRLLGRLEYVAAVISLRDVEHLAAGPARERLEAVLDLYLIGGFAAFEFSLWSFALISYGAPIGLALPAAGLISAMIVMVDIRIVAADTEPRGVLKSGPLSRAFVGMTAFRASLCLVQSLPTAVAFDLALFRSESLEVMAQTVELQNRPIYTDYERNITALRATEVDPPETQLATLVHERDAALATRFDQAKAMDDAYAESQADDLEQDRQIQGLWPRHHGDGRLAKDAHKRQQLAEARQRYLRTRQADLGSEAKDLGDQITLAEARVTDAHSRFEDEAAALRAERDVRLTKPTSGPLTAMEGLWKLHNDPESGPVVTALAMMAWMFVASVELGFFTVRTLLRGASVHDAAVNLDARRRLAALVHNFETEQRAESQRRRFRIVEGAFGSEGA